MYSILLILIYVAFVSLGLPDSLLGSGWPIMYKELNVPMSYAGIITMIISAGTVVSSLCSARLTKKLGTGMVTALSSLLTAVALFGFSISNSYILLCLWSIPYGLGAGAVDAALNNYVAIHYKSRHMSWLHCFWGVGATISPYIMSYCLTRQLGWSSGYSFVSYIQLGLTVVLFFALPMWGRGKDGEQVTEHVTTPLSLPQIVKVKGVKYTLVMFFCYCALECTAGLWASSYLSEYKGVDVDTAAKFASLFYIGITVGRLLCGFIADRLGDKNLIRYGSLIILIGIVLLGIPTSMNEFSLAGLIIIGFGCAPIYPSIIHLTPFRFGQEYSQSIIGVEMASAYIGITLIPTLFGGVADILSIGVLSEFLFIFWMIMFTLSERLNRMFSK